ncbi:MAG: ABC transporter permease, partial [Thiolinea sp.]
SAFELGKLIRRPEAGTFLGLIAVYIFFAILGGSNFISAPGWASFLNMAAEVGIIALPVGLLMIAGELDISVGSVLPAASLTTAIISGHYDLPTWMGILGGLSVGLLIGFVNGFLVSRTTIPSLIITIGTMFGTMGLTLGLTVLIAGSTGVFMTPDPVSKFLLGESIGGMFRITTLWWVGFIVVIFFLLHLSPFGNWVYALGGDKVSARTPVFHQQADHRPVYAEWVCSGFCRVSQVLTFQSAQVAAGQGLYF